MRMLHRPLRAGSAALLGLAAISLAVTFASAPSARAATMAVTPRLTAVPDSLPATTDKQTGAYTASIMSVEVVLAPRDEQGLAAELAAVYAADSGSYHRWLMAGQFVQRYAPPGAEVAAVTGYLRGAGLRVAATNSPFLIRAAGSSAKIAAAFHTVLRSYVDRRGIAYFANAATVRLPSSIAGGVQGIVGLTNTVRQHSMIARPLGKRAATPSCEAGYPTTTEFFNYIIQGQNFPVGYGGAPGCTGLTPQQTDSVYGAPAASPATQGQGVTAAVYELSAYQQSDVDTWAHTFYGPQYTPRLTDINVDGGTLAPVCPAGDICPSNLQGYLGDVEVNADIEMTLSVASDARVLVYSAPNDDTGETELDEYAVIANQDAASTVSSSWATCENDVEAGMAKAENIIFEQMALQGQSMFNASGDTGAFGCIRDFGVAIADTLDPASQPWVTGVGGTSLEADNPGSNPAPGYPAAGTETVWNTDNLCSDQAPATDNGNVGGIYWCGDTGAGGGGSSQFWGRPFYQVGPGVNNPDTAYGNGTTACALASKGTPCRQVPDVSADADPYTGYGEYCTGSVKTPNSECAFYNGWFAIGGTSLSTPLWAAMIADRDGYLGGRTGNINPLVYLWLRTDPGTYFTDITGVGPLQQAATNNGLFPTTPGYDEATGVGSPKMAAIITGGMCGGGQPAPTAGSTRT
jgi:subtilase family serine protease